MEIEWSEERLKSLYIGYCNMCSVLTIKPILIDDFNESEYKRVKETYLAFRR